MIQITLIFFCFIFWPLNAQEKEICQGLTYEKIMTLTPQVIHLLRVDPKLLEIKAVKAEGELLKRKSVSQIALEGGAIAAVNGGFFQIGGPLDGSPKGILKIEDKWFGIPEKPRGAIGWSQRNALFLMDQLLTKIYVAIDDVGKIELTFRIFPQSNPSYTKSSDWDRADYIVGGTPILVRGGEVILDFSSEKTIETFLTHRHARTAVGLLKDGRWLFLVVDGKNPKVSLGMTMAELAEKMDQLGCCEALNLDGGGSSTLFLDGKVVNCPVGDVDEGMSIVCERSVSDAILIYPKISCRNIAE